MNALAVEGHDKLFLPGCHFENIHKQLIVNLNDRWIFREFQFTDNILTITLETGVFKLKFSEKVKNITFSEEEKDQLIFNIEK